MKNLIILLIIFISITSCKQQQQQQHLQPDYPLDEIEFSIRKYVFAEDLVYAPNVEIKNSFIDSIIKYPKHLYFEDEIQSAKTVLEMLITEKNVKNQTVQIMGIDIQNKYLDSITSVYNKIKKSDSYYKCYSTITTEPIEVYVSDTFILDEHYQVIDTFFYVGELN